MKRKPTHDEKYGYRHRQWARRLPNPEGQPCPRCGNPMYRYQHLDLGHVKDVVDGGVNGPRRWEHRSCNRSAGGKRGRYIQTQQRPPRTGDAHTEDW